MVTTDAITWTDATGATGGSGAWHLGVGALDASKAFVGSSGGQHKTTDTGASWTTTSLPTGIVEVLDMQPIDASTVFGVGGNSGGSPKNNFIRSSDGGATWTPSDAGVGHFGTDRLVHLDFLSAMTGWVVGHVGQVGFTTDGGVSFANKSPAGDATQYDDLQAVSASTVYIAGRFGTIKKTTDTGASKGAQLRNN